MKQKREKGKNVFYRILLFLKKTPINIVLFLKTSYRFRWVLGSVLVSLVFPIVSIIEHTFFGVHKVVHAGHHEDTIWHRFAEVVIEYLDPNFNAISYFNRLIILFAPIILLVPFGLLISELFVRTRRLLASVEQSRNEITQYSAQLENITENIQEGICIINPEYTIQLGVNKRFEEIFNKDNVVGRSIFDEIFLYLNEEDKTGLQRFFLICFSKKDITQTTLNRACPITKFWYNTLDIKSNKIKEQTIAFQVLLIRSSEKKVTQLLLLFKDITYQELITQDKELFINADYEVEFLQQMIRLDLPKVIQYWNNFTFVSDKIFTQATLLSEEHDDSAIELLQDIAGAVHSLKGDSLVANQMFLAEHCKKIEPLLKSIIANEIHYDFGEQLQVINWVSELQEFKNNLQVIVERFNLEGGTRTDTPSGSNNVAEAEMTTMIRDIEDIIKNDNLLIATQEKLRSMRKILQHSSMYDLYNFEQEMHTMLNAIMEQEQVSNVSLSFRSAFNLIPKSLYNSLHEIFIHIIRNFFAHGYQTEEERVSQNKYKKAILRIAIHEDHSNYIIQYREDSKGFDLEEIVQTALNLRLVTEAWAYVASEQDIISLIFQPALSTRDGLADAAGAGQGMYVVQKNITDSQGTIKIQNTFGQGYAMLITIPKSD